MNIDDLEMKSGQDKKEALKKLKEGANEIHRAMAFKEISEEISKSTLITLTTSEYPIDIRKRAIHFMNNEDFKDKKKQILQNDISPSIRVAVANSVGESGPNSILLLSLGKRNPDENPYVRAMAISNLNTKEEETRGTVKRIVRYHAENDPHPYVRIQAIEKLRPHEDFDILSKLYAEDENPGVRSTAARRLPQVINDPIN